MQKPCSRSFRNGDPRITCQLRSAVLGYIWAESECASTHVPRPLPRHLCYSLTHRSIFIHTRTHKHDHKHKYTAQWKPAAGPSREPLPASCFAILQSTAVCPPGRTHKKPCAMRACVDICHPYPAHLCTETPPCRTQAAPAQPSRPSGGGAGSGALQAEVYAPRPRHGVSAGLEPP